MTPPSVATLVHESLGERVYKSLRDPILSQAYAPGSKLNVEQPCRDLGVSVADHRAEHLSRAHSDHVLEDALDFTNRAEPSPRFVGVHTAPGTAPRGCGVPIAAARSGRHRHA